ncbi:MAG: arylsulfatase A-like enzyme/acetyl esterase/lipase [Planctomycetota bacterium]|jgi:arylsulfatase A-like enzyme/acetyl esterase/lipase
MHYRRLTLDFLRRALVIGFALLGPLQAQDARPNVLWITSEDNGPQLGCYGDDFATTPNLDALAGRGMRYERAWSNAPVCAPARTTIITGMYAPSLGAQHMRSLVPLPEGLQLFPQYLRQAGYYCTNNSKEDYNVEKPEGVWDVSGRKGHWRGRAEDQPFFSVFNITTTHESRIRKRPHKAVHEAASVPVPAFHPDHPIVREDWAQYYDKMSEMDAQVGRILAELEADGLAEDTIVFYYGDHGPGMPRGKRWPYDSGLRVPMIVHFPERFRELAPSDYGDGALSKRLVGFVDLAPTVLSLAGVEAPAFMQGAAFAGEHTASAPKFLHGYRDRMDERVDLVRSITDGRYVYIRNFMPHVPQGAFLDYMFVTPTTRIWKQLYDQGELTEAGQRRFWEPKSPEELYDLASDPDEVHNLELDPDLQGIRSRLWTAMREHLIESGDLGFLPEGEMQRLRGEGSPRELALRDLEANVRLPLLAADASTRNRSIGEKPKVFRAGGRAYLQSSLPAVRYWGRSWFLTPSVPGQDAKRDEAAVLELTEAMQQAGPSERILLAQIALRWELPDLAQSARAVLMQSANLEQSTLFDAVHALNVIDDLDADSAWPDKLVERLRQLPRKDARAPGRVSGYVSRLLNHILTRHPPARVERVYKSVGDVELALHIHQPSGAAPKAGRPAVVFFHGGGWNGGNPSQFFDHCEHLARQGLVGISAAYRLKKVHGTSPYECVADGKSAMRWVRAHAAELGIDPERIAAGGGSAGGHVAAAVATVEGFDDEPKSELSCRPCALILFNPVYDNGPNGYGQARVREHWQAFSPLHNIRPGIAPSIVFLGTKDSLIPVGTAEDFQARVIAAGGRSELRLYEGQPHGFFNRGTSPEMYAATVAEMDRFLRSLGMLR